MAPSDTTIREVEQIAEGAQEAAEVASVEATSAVLDAIQSEAAAENAQNAAEAAANAASVASNIAAANAAVLVEAMSSRVTILEGEVSQCRNTMQAMEALILATQQEVSQIATALSSSIPAPSEVVEEVKIEQTQVEPENVAEESPVAKIVRRIRRL